MAGSVFSPPWCNWGASGLGLGRGKDKIHAVWETYQHIQGKCVPGESWQGPEAKRVINHTDPGERELVLGRRLAPSRTRCHLGGRAHLSPEQDGDAQPTQECGKCQVYKTVTVTVPVPFPSGVGSCRGRGRLLKCS